MLLAYPWIFRKTFGQYHPSLLYFLLIEVTLKSIAKFIIHLFKQAAYPKKELLQGGQETCSKKLEIEQCVYRWTNFLWSSESITMSLFMENMQY